MANSTTTTLEQLRAFTKLYGYVRYFHPSDEAQLVDWDRLALYGVDRVQFAGDTASLRDTLRSLFLPVAPTISIYLTEEPPASAELIDDPSGSATVAWQHLGVGLGAEPYRSIRTNRMGATVLDGREDEPVAGQLFEALPKIGEAVDKPLNGALSCRIPLCLHSDSSPPDAEGLYSLQGLREQLEHVEVSQLNADSESVRLANVVIAWNVFQHFYPYFDDVDTDWDVKLTDVLGRALSDRSELDFWYTLGTLTAALQDGHAVVEHSLISQFAGFPFVVDWIEDSAVIIATRVASSDYGDPRFNVGDIVVAIDGIEPGALLRADAWHWSGSSRIVKYRSLGRFGYGPKGSVATLVTKRGATTNQYDVERTHYFYRHQALEPGKPASQIDRVADDIIYVDLTRADMAALDDMIEELALAKGVVFDLRGYPNGNHEVLNHLLCQEDTSTAWMKIPQILYPDRQQLSGYECHGWGLKPREPHIGGKVAFLVNGLALSYAESFLSFVEHYRLGEIVGEATAGVNGNVNRIDLLGGFSIPFTGMKVVKHDGARHHLVGIQPTVPVARTVKGVIDGRDEVLERALEVLRDVVSDDNGFIGSHRSR